MANAGHAPKIFTRLNRFSIPWIAVGLLSLFMALGYMSLEDTASTVSLPYASRCLFTDQVTPGIHLAARSGCDQHVDRLDHCAGDILEILLRV